MSDQILTAGRASVSVTSGAAVDLLSTSTTGVSVAGISRWCLTVSTDQNVTVSLYKAAGSNAGLALVTTYSVTSAAPLVLDVSPESAQRVRVTAIAASTTATVNCDLAGRA
jgi:hypothetical protein